MVNLLFQILTSRILDHTNDVSPENVHRSDWLRTGTLPGFTRALSLPHIFLTASYFCLLYYSTRFALPSTEDKARYRVF